jgi:uncharacterized protein (TIGR00375 family)
MASQNFVADFHLHSHFSRATSKDMDLSGMYRWGKIKGINVIGTGDFTHPQWLTELQEQLEPLGNGLFQLKKELAVTLDKTIPSSCRHNPIFFVLTSEISNIYKKHDQVRKLHNVIVAPDFATVIKMNAKLMSIGNLHSDGRPILGLDSKELLRISLEASDKCIFIPAHIWTPWFAMFGSKSGFNTVEAAFEDLTPYIYAVETGLSSDPAMNWRLSQLDNLLLVSNSDAHSPRNLGREANVFNCEFDYQEMFQAIKTKDDRFVGTIEFFPEEGKYHYDGHRSCNVSFNPEETKKLQGICPVCHKPLVLGVDYRVTELADRAIGFQPKHQKQVEYIVPLAPMIAEIKKLGSVSAKAVISEYDQVISKLGDEFSILRNLSIEQINAAGFPFLARAIKKMRTKDLYIKPGYDGVFGVVQVFKPGEMEADVKQLELYA